MKKWQCTVCKYIHVGDTPPDVCPMCGVSSEEFIDITDSGPALDKELEKKLTIAKESINGECPICNFTANILLKKHIHPISVHFPNGIIPVIVILYFLSFILGNDLFAKVAFIDSIAVLLMMPLVFISGVLEWQKRYLGKFKGLFPVKIISSIFTLLFLATCVTWYWLQPNVLQARYGWLFLLFNVFMLGSVGISGHIGGKLVFKD